MPSGVCSRSAAGRVVRTGCATRGGITLCERRCGRPSSSFARPSRAPFLPTSKEDRSTATREASGAWHGRAWPHAAAQLIRGQVEARLRMVTTGCRASSGPGADESTSPAHAAAAAAQGRARADPMADPCGAKGSGDSLSCKVDCITAVKAKVPIYSLACVGVEVAPARARAARLILFRPSFRTAFLGPKSIFNKTTMPAIAMIRAVTTATRELPGCI